MKKPDSRQQSAKSKASVTIMEDHEESIAEEDIPEVLSDEDIPEAIEDIPDLEVTVNDEEGGNKNGTLQISVLS